MKTKRNNIIIITAMILVLLISQPAVLNASPNEIHTEVTYLPDGSYFQTVITEDPIRISGTKTGTKTLSYSNADGVTVWDIIVKGTFSYTGNSSTCTSSTVSANSYNSTWKIADKSATKSGNKASGTVTAKQYYLIVCIETMTKTVNLYCDKNGNLS